jgi:hypothetical protein
MRRLRNQFPPYPSPLSVGPRVYGALAAWNDAATILQGTWVIPAMIIAGLIGLWHRERVLLLTSATAFAQLVTAALGDAPSPRRWVTILPFFVMSVLLATAEFAWPTVSSGSSAPDQASVQERHREG